MTANPLPPPPPTPATAPAAPQAQAAQPTSTPRARLGIADQLRRDGYLLRFELLMQDYPGAASRRIRKDLRTELDLAAADVGMRQGLADLGSPRQLAAGYYEQLDHPRPRYWDGAVVAGLLGLLLVFTFLGYLAGSLDTLTAQGGGRVTLAYFGAPLTLVSGAAGLRGELEFSPLALAGVLAVVAGGFALGSRIWRLASGRRAAGEPHPGPASDASAR